MSARQPPAASDSYPSSLKGSTVVLVENDLHLQNLIETLLRREGYLVVTICNLAALPQRQQARVADLLILDLAPMQAGAAAIPGLLNDVCADGRLPVLVLSTYNEQECRARLPNLDAAAYLSKPFRNRELIAAVTRILDGAKDGAAKGR